MPEVELLKDQKRVLSYLREHGDKSRVEIARALGLQNSEMTRYGRELLALGLIEQGEEEKAKGRGRPSKPLSIRKDGVYSVGAIVHPGWVEITLVNFMGEVISTDVNEYQDRTPEAFAKLLFKRVRVLTSDKSFVGSKFLGYGISVPGYATISPSHRMTVKDLSSWHGIDLSAFFEEHLGARVWIENDATAAALAEYYNLGHGARQSVLAIYIGYGVGAGVISRGGVYRGGHFNAGEISSFYPIDQPRPSALDLLGVLKSSGANIQTLYDFDKVSVKYASVIESWCERAAGQLFIAVQSGIAWHDPDCIVVTSALPTVVVNSVSKHLKKMDWSQTMGNRPMPNISGSRLGTASAAIGAAHLPIHHISSPSIV